MICKGVAFQNEGMNPAFETDDFPHDTFELTVPDGVCSPGVEADIWAVVDTDAGTATFHSEVE